MSRHSVSLGGSHPRLASVVYDLSRPLFKAMAAAKSFYCADSPIASNRLGSMRDKVRRGEPVYLVGIGPSGHNSGVALVEASQARGIRLICNNEEERFTGIKHDKGYPELSIEALGIQLDELGLSFRDVHAWLASWDYVSACSFGLSMAIEEAPAGLGLLRSAASPKMNRQTFMSAFAAPRRLADQIGTDKPVPVIGMRHHDNHAYFSFCASPFNFSKDPVIVTVIDGFGDDGSISFYVAENGKLTRLRSNRSMFDSLGLLYSVISSTQGGWTTLSSEGRFMGASAWGDTNRPTNPYYQELRQILVFASEGRIYLNRRMANWHRKGELNPYTNDLARLLGAPVAPQRQRNPDFLMTTEDLEHGGCTVETAQKAAALQLLFEDALFHVVGHLVRSTGSDKLVLTGGTALNCVANMRLLDHFDEDYYRRYLSRDSRLHIWVPPTPGDAGVAMGAAYNFAATSGVPMGKHLEHAFYCGLPPSDDEILKSTQSLPDVACLRLGNVSEPSMRGLIADLMAYIVSEDGILGIFQGVAETGPRALGHRSIIANPCNPNTLQNLNQRVKFREPLRPLAPMVTYESADRWFVLSPGASAGDWNAYNYMVLSVRARPESHRVIPAVIHRDGTARIQIVRRETDPFVHDYLTAMGRRVGAEVSVNTSLNVKSPIVQTPQQALRTLRLSRGMDGLFLIGAGGNVFLAWHNVSDGVKDAGHRLRTWLRVWKEESGVSEDRLQLA